MASVWTAAKPTSTGCAPAELSTGPPTARPSGPESMSTVPIAVSTRGRIAAGGRSVRRAWIGGFTRPLKSPERKIAAATAVAAGWKASTQSGSAWP